MTATHKNQTNITPRATREGSYTDALKVLEEHASNASPQPVESPTELPLEVLHTLKAVFQPRTEGGGTYLTQEGTYAPETSESEVVGDEVVIFSEVAASEAHVRELAEGIKSSPTGTLEPITVWWSGQKWYVIDGHHRLYAYHRVKGEKRLKTSLIPVKAIAGSYQDAYREGLRGNSRNKLPVSKKDKHEGAWRMVKMGKTCFTKPQINEATGASNGLIGEMRKKHVEMLEAVSAEELHEWSWDEARKWPQEIRKEWDLDAVEAQAMVWAKRLGVTFGPQFAKNPEIAARALTLYSEAMVERLKQYWSYDDEEAEQEF